MLRKLSTSTLIILTIVGCSEPNQIPDVRPAPEMPDWALFAPEFGETVQGLSPTSQISVLPPSSPEVFAQSGDDPDDPCGWPAHRRPDVVLQNVSEKQALDLLYSTGGFYAMQVRIDPCVSGGAVLESAVVAISWNNGMPPLVGFALRRVVQHEWVLGGNVPQGGYFPLYQYQGVSTFALGRHTGNNYYELTGELDMSQVNLPVSFELTLKGWYFTTYDQGGWRPSRVYIAGSLGRKVEFQ